MYSERLAGVLIARKRANIRNRYDQAPHLTQNTNGKVTNSQLDITIEISPLYAAYLANDKDPKERSPAEGYCYHSPAIPTYNL